MRPPGCSDGSLEVAEPLAGTSSHAVAWVALEQDGPWGPRALTDSHLDPVVGRRLDESVDVAAALLGLDFAGRTAGDEQAVRRCWGSTTSTW